MIAFNTAPTVTDLASGAKGTPLFVMAGACPSSLPPTGMQAVVYTSMGPSLPVDFWWLKPRAGSTSQLEEATLNRHAKGSHKNDPGASKRAYGVYAQLFAKANTSPDGKLRYGIATQPPMTLANGSANGGAAPTPRAYIDCLVSGRRYYLCWVWMEEFSSLNPLAKKWLRGKIIYQREDAPGRFFARCFRFVEGQGLLLPADDHLEESVDAVLPADRIKLGCTA